MRADLVTDALAAAIRTRGSLAGSIMHTDHGAQYTSRAFAEACRSAGVRRIMSAVGSSADNALAESFNATLKRETLQGRKSWPTERQARLDTLPMAPPLQHPTPTLPPRTTIINRLREHLPPHKLRWHKPHNPCSGFEVKALAPCPVGLLCWAEAHCVRSDPPAVRAVCSGAGAPGPATQASVLAK